MNCAIYSLFQFSYLYALYKPNNITTKLSLKVKSSKLARQREINIRLWTHMRHKGWRKNGKTFTRCYTIAVKFWDEFNANYISQVTGH